MSQFYFCRGPLAPALLLIIVAGTQSISAQAPQPAHPAPPPPAFQPTPEMLAIQAASEKEHQREMDLLGIKELRSPVDNTSDSPHPVNYDESKADVYKNLPDPLVMNNGARVTTASQWWKERRPQIVELFDREMYGRTPADLPAVKWEVVSTTNEKNGDVPIITKKLLGHVDNSWDPAVKIDIDLEVSTPANAKGPVPVIMELGLGKAILEMFRKRFPQMFADQKGPTWQQQVLAKGWGYAEYIPVSVQGDSAAEMTGGIIGLMNKGQPRKLDDWGVPKRGRGERASASTTLRQTRPSKQNRSASKATRAMARQRWWPWPMTHASPSATSVPPGRAAPSCRAMCSASRWRIRQARRPSTGSMGTS